MADEVDSAGAGDGVESGLARPGSITYLHIPVPDPRGAAAFYRDVFGWEVSGLDGDHPSFSDPGGPLAGAWISGGDATPGAGPLAYIYVTDPEAAVKRIVAYGGEIVEAPRPEGMLRVARFRDPGGNVLGIWHDTTRAGGSGADGSGAPGSAPPVAPVAPVPEHLHTITARLMITDAPAAIDFYARAFGAQEISERFCTPDGTVMHAELRIGDSVVMVAEGEGYTALLCTYWEDVDAAWERAVAAGAEVIHQLEDHFYGERGGRLRDPFGHEWMLGARTESLTAAEMDARLSGLG